MRVKPLTVFAGLAVVGFGGPVLAEYPKFDCTKAVSDVQKEICAKSDRVMEDMAGDWSPVSDTSSPAGLALANGSADFGAAGQYRIEPVRMGGRTFRVLEGSEGSSQLDCGGAPARFVTFLRRDDRLEVQFFGGETDPGEPDPGVEGQPMAGACGMDMYQR